MELLKEISEGSLGIGDLEQLNTGYELRKSARAIVKNAEGKIAIQHLQNYSFHTLPGGGIDPGETVEQVAAISTIVTRIGMATPATSKLRRSHSAISSSAHTRTRSATGSSYLLPLGS